MRKLILFSGMALVASAAFAQYNVDPSTSVVVKENPKTVNYITMSEGAVADFKAAGAQVTYIGPDADQGRNLWYWDQTFLAGDESYPRVDMEEGGYISVVVSNIGWSGAGVAVSLDGFAGISTEDFNENTRFHLAYMTPSGNGPASIAIILCDGDLTGSAPAKVALGDPFNDNGAIFPSIGAKINDDWQGVDISFADLKKLYPSFNVVNSKAWGGNIMSWLGGGIEGQTMAFDAVYFYNTKESGIGEVVAQDASDFVVSANAINVNNGNGITLYNLAGQAVKSTNGCTLGLGNVQSGIYLARSGNATVKVVVR